MRSKQRLKRLEATARRQGRLKKPSVEREPYVVGAIDPLTGRPQGPNIDDYTDAERVFFKIPPGITNAQNRAGMREMFTALGLPPLGHPLELTEEEWKKVDRIMDNDPERDRLDMPCNSWDLTFNQNIQCTYWHDKVERGEMTREEYHRLALEMVGLPPKPPPTESESKEPAE